ncbi:50S ribosomal protein L20 [candidate division WOR-3 bacterium 4484_100]|uniref:Large ribosomal subunit protein bL20 n=1 Tax=candidate division WOR-3 bacterium 4484_100 TaxID=1936077 RepID=A0A1V4QF96_UNCW3|nr:MAG: 50S ribosomal protein L20 [candidate division WOR-3 bacterium 4484_100]
MPRTKNVPYTRKRRKKWLKAAKGYWGAKHRLYKTARIAVMKALTSAYRERKRKKRVFRTLWITRINAALRAQGLKYSDFMATLRKNNIGLNRKSLAYLAYEHPEAFNSLIQLYKKEKGLDAKAD